jgi:hypothetical protein
VCLIERDEMEVLYFYVRLSQILSMKTTHTKGWGNWLQKEEIALLTMLMFSCTHSVRFLQTATKNPLGRVGQTRCLVVCVGSLLFFKRVNHEVGGANEACVVRFYRNK